MARTLTPAQREELSARAYELSLHGHSAREIGRELKLSHKTVSRYLRLEAARRRQEQPDYKQFALDSHRRAVRRCWDELDKHPSPHAAAQLLHALNASLASIELIAGVRAPARSQNQVTHEVRCAGISAMSEAEKAALELLISKAQGQLDEDADVLGEILRRHQAGTLTFGEDEILELEPVEG